MRIKDDPNITSKAYTISVQGVEVAKGEVRPGLLMVISPSDTPLQMPGEKVKDPTFGLDAMWVERSFGAEAERQGYTNTVTLTEHVRKRLANQICKALTDQTGFVPVITLNAAWEKEFIEAVRINGDERNFLMSPQRVQEFVLAARKQIQQFAAKDEWPALMVAPEVRHFVRSMLERVSPMTSVISHNEVHRKAHLRTVATIGS